LTFGDLKSLIQSFTPELTLTTIGNFINKRYQQLLKAWQWSFLKGYANLQLVAPYSTGTVSVTNSSTTVTGSGTSWTSAMAGRHFRLGSAIPFYKISAVVSATEITLASAYGGDTATGQTYEIFQHIYSLASDVREISKIVYDLALIEKSVEWIERNDPYRSISGTPLFYADRGIDASGYRQVEIHPYPSDDYVLRCSYWKSVSNLSADTDTILVRDDLLQELTLLDCYRVAANSNPNYLNFLPVVSAQIQWLWNEAVAEDMRKSSAEFEVKDYTTEEGRLGSDWEVNHWAEGSSY
jgi:hypothetical protein